MHVIILEVITPLSIAAELARDVIRQKVAVRALRAVPANPQQPRESVSIGVRAFPGIYVRDDDWA